MHASELAAEQCGQFLKVGIHQTHKRYWEKKKQQVSPTQRLQTGCYGLLKF